MDRDDQLSLTTPTLSTASALFAVHVPAKDLPAFYALQERNQERIKLLFQAFQTINEAPTLTHGYDLAAAQLAGQRGYSAKRLRSLFTEFRKCRDWRCLIDGALEYKPSTSLPAEFIDHLNTEVDQNGRSMLAVIKRIRAAWTQGKHIPGYGTWQQHWRRIHPGRPMPRIAPEHPTGWTPRNLHRQIDTSKFRRTAATQGRIAAKHHRPMVLGTRQGCWVHSHLMWDDVWHDLFVNSFGEKQAGRPLELFSHDYYSARKVRWGLRVRTEDDSGKAQGLTAKMMRMVVAATYYLDGYSPRGTINLAEHGTAAFMDDMAATLYDASGGLITVQESGMQGKAAIAGQYDGRSIGNPNFKASLESSNNLLHNMEGHLPGQTGPDRQRRPEQLHGLLKYNSQLLAAYQQLPPDKAALLQFPLLEVNQYIGVLSEIYEFIESDPDHDLEGWINCGHITQELQILGEWRSQAEVMSLPSGERDLVIAMLNNNAIASRPRKLTRREVWQAGASDLIRISGGTVCQILGPEFGQERKVSSHQFTFKDKEVGPGDHIFEAIITDAEGRQYALKDGETYLAFVNPFAPDQLFVQDAKGRFLGTCLRSSRASRADIEALKRSMGHAAHIEQELLAPLAQRQAKETRKKLALHRHNTAVIAGTNKARTDLTTSAIDALDATLPEETEDTIQPTQSPNNEDIHSLDW